MTATPSPIFCEHLRAPRRELLLRQGRGEERRPVRADTRRETAPASTQRRQRRAGLRFIASDYSGLHRAVPLSARPRRSPSSKPSTACPCPIRTAGSRTPRQPGDPGLGRGAERADALDAGRAGAATRSCASSPRCSITRGPRPPAAERRPVLLHPQPGPAQSAGPLRAGRLRGAAARPARSQSLSADGTTALTAIAPSPDGRLVAYALSEHGSDRQVIRIRDAETAIDRDDRAESREVRQHRVDARRVRLLLPAVPGTRQRARRKTSTTSDGSISTGSATRRRRTRSIFETAGRRRKSSRSSM